MLPKPRAERINYRRLHPPLTGGPHYAETAGHARVRYHYDVATEGLWRLVTSAPTSPTMCAVALPEKARPAAHDRDHNCGHLMAWSLTK
jgi:hypothetical protein